MFQVGDALFLCLDLALVGLDIIHEHGPLIFTSSTRSNCLLKPLQQLIFGLIQVLYERAHPLNLGVQVIILLLLRRKVLPCLTKVILQSLSFVLDKREGLLEIHDLQLSLVLVILRLE